MRAAGLSPFRSVCAKALAVAFLFALYPLHTPAAEVLGRVVDAESGSPLPGAHVSVTAGSSGTPILLTTSGDGSFRARDLPDGPCLVEVRFIGYRKETLRLKAADAALPVLIALEPTLLWLDEITVRSVSRRPEKAVDAPAFVQVLDGAEILDRPALTPVEHLKSMAGVDVATAGLTQSRVAVRGFNNVISNSDRLLILTDFRNTRVPSVRINNFQLIPTINEDIDRIEVVAGPGSALYGPNAANGVMHIITKSPFDSQGGHVTLGAGERGLFTSSFRQAGLLAPKVGFKVSGRYTRGRDWSFDDPAEPDSIQKGVATLSGRQPVGGVVSNARKRHVEAASLDARFDLRPADGLAVVLSAGASRSSSVNLSDFGAIQHHDWRAYYVQARASTDDFFAQVFLNRGDLDNPDAYLLRTGDLVVEKSTAAVAQVQHGLTLVDGRQRLTYGLDAFLTRPNTEVTINGRNESSDDVDEYGAYVQSETMVTGRLKAVLAGRLDHHSHLDDPVFSPRVGVVFSPEPEQSLRVTYNRAFTTPPNPVLFLDINFAPSLGPLPFPLQGLGIPKTGFTFRRDAAAGAGGLTMQSPFNPAGPADRLPAEATQMWGTVVGLMAAAGVDISGIPAPGPGDVETSLRLLNTATGTFDPVSPADVRDLPAFEPSITNTVEVGYRGVVSDRWILDATVYRSRVENFISALSVRTPNVFYDASSLTGYLTTFMPADQAAGLAGGIAAIPVGTVAPEESGVTNPANIVLTWVNFPGDITLYGGDLSVAFHPGPRWQLAGQYAYVSDHFFPRDGRLLEDIALNAPKHKLSGSVRYAGADGWSGQVRVRFVDGFPVRSGAYSGDVEAYWTADVNAAWSLPFSPGTRLTASVSNVFDNRHQEYVGAPQIGRLAQVQLMQSF